MYIAHRRPLRLPRDFGNGAMVPPHRFAAGSWFARSPVGRVSIHGLRGSSGTHVIPVLPCGSVRVSWVVAASFFCLCRLLFKDLEFQTPL